MTTVTVLSGPERRRRWTSTEKHRIVEESLAPATTVIDVARRHDIHPNLLHLWRRQARRGPVTPVGRSNDAPADEVRFASVAIARDERESLAPPGMIEIEFASGTRLRITGLVDAATVSAAIAAASGGEPRG
jgi:transposase